MIYINMDDLKNAKEFFDYSQQLIQKVNVNNLLIAKIYNNIGLYYFKISDFQNSSLNYFTSNLLIERSGVKNTLQEAVLLNNYALLSYELGKYDLALINFSKSLVIFEKNKINNYIDYIVLLNYISSLLIDLQNLTII